MHLDYYLALEGLFACIFEATLLTRDVVCLCLGSNIIHLGYNRIRHE